MRGILKASFSENEVQMVLEIFSDEVAVKAAKATALQHAVIVYSKTSLKTFDNDDPAMKKYRQRVNSEHNTRGQNSHLHLIC